METDSSLGFVLEEDTDRFNKLFDGIRDREDTVTWRTMLLDMKRMLARGYVDEDWLPAFHGLPEGRGDEAEELVDELVGGTFLEPLKAEIMSALGLRGDWGGDPIEIGTLFVNSRHFPEPLLWTMAEKFNVGQTVAVVNPVGHYSDEQTRVVMPAGLEKKAKRLVFSA